MIRRYFSPIALPLFWALAIQGCAHPQAIRVNSIPSGATIYCQDKNMGETPLKIKLDRRLKSVDLGFDLTDYRPHTEKLIRKKSGSFIARSIVFAGLSAASFWILDDSDGKNKHAAIWGGISLATNLTIGLFQGDQYRLEPARVEVTLHPEAPPSK